MTCDRPGHPRQAPFPVFASEHPTRSRERAPWVGAIQVLGVLVSPAHGDDDGSGGPVEGVRGPVPRAVWEWEALSPSNPGSSQCSRRWLEARLIAAAPGEAQMYFLPLQQLWEFSPHLCHQRAVILIGQQLPDSDRCVWGTPCLQLGEGCREGGSVPAAWATTQDFPVGCLSPLCLRDPVCPCPTGVTAEGIWAIFGASGDGARGLSPSGPFPSPRMSRQPGPAESWGGGGPVLGREGCGDSQPCRGVWGLQGLLLLRNGTTRY